MLIHKHYYYHLTSLIMFLFDLQNDVLLINEIYFFQNKNSQIFWASGSCFFIKNDLFRELNGFDEDFFAHQEEIDLCWKFHLMGKETWAIPSAVVYHKNAVTLPMFSRKKQYLNHRNSMLMVLTNYSLPLTLYIAPIRIALEFVALIYSMFRFDMNHMIGIVQSLFWIFFHIWIEIEIF